jgi:predicted nucleic acid-binding protein
MRGEILVDSNVLVYAYDRSEPAKQRAAASLLDRLFDSRTGILTAQVVAEFFVIVTRKITAPLDPTTAAERVHNFVRSWPVLDVTPLVVLEATRGTAVHNLHYWDAQLWAAARLNQIDLILTEDLPSAQILEGVRFLDPFAPGFSLLV